MTLWQYTYSAVFYNYLIMRYLDQKCVTCRKCYSGVAAPGSRMQATAKWTFFLKIWFLHSTNFKLFIQTKGNSVSHSVFSFAIAVRNGHLKCFPRVPKIYQCHWLQPIISAVAHHNLWTWHFWSCIFIYVTWIPVVTSAVVYPGILFSGGSTNSVEDRENGDLGVVAP